MTRFLKGDRVSYQMCELINFVLIYHLSLAMKSRCRELTTIQTTIDKNDVSLRIVVILIDY